MSGLNANKLPQNSSKGIAKQNNIDGGTYQARVVSVLDLGLQTQRPYQGQDKPPKHEIRLTYELLDEFCLDEEGNEVEDKPRWISEDFPFNSLSADLAKSTKRYVSIDPKGECDGDFTLLVNFTCMVQVLEKAGTGKHLGKVFNNVGNVTPMRPKDAAKAAPLVNEPKVFVLDEPNLEVFLALPEFLQDKIKGNLEFNGSALQKLLGGEAPKAEEPASEPEGDTPAEDVEW